MTFGQIFCILFTFTNTSIAQILSRPTPSSLYGFEFELMDSAYTGNYLSIPIHMKIFEGEMGYKIPTPMVLDRFGFVRLYIPNDYRNTMDFHYFPNHNLYSALRIRGHDFSYQVYDENFNLIDTISNSEGILGDSHEFQIMQNGNYLIGGKSFDTIDLESMVINDLPVKNPVVIRNYVIEEFDRKHNLVFQWNSNDHIDPLDAYKEYGYNAVDFDYCHGNAIDEDLDGNLLVSFRSLNAIYKIDRFSGHVIWILGGKSSHFTFPDDNGFSGQHDVRRLSNGHLTLFDNGNMKTPPTSRTVEYKLDTIAWTAHLFWEYKDSCTIFSPAMGNHHTTKEGQHLINYGLSFRPSPSATLVASDGKIISNLYFRDSVASYRVYAQHLSLDIERPKITYTPLKNGLILTAPSSYQNYAWSNNMSTRSIFVTRADCYQVWTNYGDLMVGSEPFLMTDLDDIHTVNVPAHNNPDAVLAIYNSQGIEVREVSPDKLYLVLYADHTVSKMTYLD